MNRIYKYNNGCILFVLFLAGGWGVHAQTDNGADTTFFLPSFQVEESRVVLPVSYTHMEFDSLTKMQYEEASLDRMLSKHSGMFIKNYGVSAISTPSLRGTAASHTRVYWNGMELNSPMNGTFDLSLLPVSFFDRIRINKGASSLIDGPGGLGGSISMDAGFRKKGGHDFSVTQTAGSFDKYRTSGGYAYGGENMQVNVKGFYQQAENDFPYIDVSRESRPVERRSNAAMVQGGAVSDISYQLSEDNRMAFHLLYVESDRELPGGILSGSSDERQLDQLYKGVFEWKRNGDAGDMTLRMGGQYDRLVYENPGSGIYSLAELKGGFAQLIRTLRLGRIDVVAKYRGSYDFAYSGGYSGTEERLNNSLCLAASREFGRFQVDMILREVLNGDSFSPLLPGLGWTLSIDKRRSWLWKGNVSMNYRFPTLNDLYWTPGGNEDLEPEYSRLAETGIVKEISSGGISIKAGLNAYYKQIDNWIAWVPGKDGSWSAKNYKEVENKGAELSLNSTFSLLGINAHLGMNLNYVSAVNTATSTSGDAAVRKQLIYVPSESGDVSLSLGKKGYYLFYSYSYTGERFITTDNSMYMPSFRLSDLSAGKKMYFGKQMLELRFSVHNLLDEPYQVIAWQPMPGRNYELMLKLNLHYDR